MKKKTRVSRSEIEGRLVYCGFAPFRSVDGRTDIGRMFPGKPSGIYVLAYKDGGYYIGLSIDIKSRFKQHVITKRPIAAMTLRKVRQPLHDSYESQTISMLEQMGVDLGNTVKLKSESSDDDRKLAPADVKRWLKDPSWNDLRGKQSEPPRPDSDIEERYRNEFLLKPYAKNLTEFYAAYVRRCIIKPFQTVPHKWNVTCLPNMTYRVGKCISTLNVGGQASVLVAEKDGRIRVYFSMRKSELRRVHPRGIPRLKALAPSLREESGHMKMLGENQQDMSVSLDEAKAVLKDTGLIRAIRALVVHDRGMGLGGSSIYKRFHCYSFAKDILARSKRIK